MNKEYWKKVIIRKSTEIIVTDKTYQWMLDFMERIEIEAMHLPVLKVSHSIYFNQRKKSKLTLQ